MGVSCIVRQVSEFSVIRTMFVLGVGECDMHALMLGLFGVSYGHYDSSDSVRTSFGWSSDNIIILSLCVFHSEFRKATRTDLFQVFDSSTTTSFTLTKICTVLLILLYSKILYKLKRDGITISFVSNPFFSLFDHGDFRFSNPL